MVCGCRSDYLACNQLAIDELDEAQALLNVTKGYCEQKEFGGDYYGGSKNVMVKLSEERNYYIRILNILSEKISKITDLNLDIESELLNKNSDNCGRKITTKRTAD